MTPTLSDLTGAAMLSLEVAATSPAASAFTSYLATTLRTLEGRTNARRSPEAVAAFHRAVGTIAGSLLLNWRRGELAGTSRLSFRPTQKAHFTGQQVTHAAYTGAVAALAAGGMIGQQPAFRRFHGAGEDRLGAKSWAGRLWPTPELLGSAAAHGVDLDEIEKHYRVARPRIVADPVEVREFTERSEGDKLKGMRLSVPATDHARRIALEVQRINDMIADHDLRTTPASDPVRLRRSFTADLDLHGRWYCDGGGYQQLPGATRHRCVTIGGAPCLEVDVAASHLTVLSGYLGLPWDPAADPYSITGLSDRRIAKSWVTASIGRGAALRDGRWPRAVVAKAAADGLDLAAWPVGEVADLILSRWPVLADLPDRFDALGARYSVPAARVIPLFVMGLEARALTAAMIELADSGIAAAPVHDSLLIPIGDRAAGVVALRRAFEQTLGVTPRLRVTGGDGDTAVRAQG